MSIFGNTGDGKSHTLNHTLFNGEEVFKTSHLQSSCTAGVWAAYDTERRAIVLDTEGLLGISTNENRRTRLLLKVVSPVFFPRFLCQLYNNVAKISFKMLTLVIDVQKRIEK